MTDRKVADVLLGGQPKTDSPPVGATSETRMLGRGESVSAETINRGTYAVAKEVDKVFAELQRLSRKAVTVNGQQQYAVGTVTNVFDEPNTDNLNPFVGADPGNSADGLFQVLQPGSSAAYEESVEGAFTVYRAAPTVADPVAFQVRTLVGYAGPVEIRFVAGGALAISTTALPDRITVTYAPGDDYAAVAAAINVHGTASTWVAAVGDVGVVVSTAGLNTSIITAGAFIFLRSKTSVDADVTAVLIDDPITGVDIPTPDIFIVERTALNTVTLRTAVSGGGAVVAGDYLVFGINAPTQVTAPTGRYQTIKVATGSTPASIATDVVTLEADLTLIATLGFLDPEVFVVAYRYKAKFWAVGHPHAFDVPGTPVNPRKFTFGETDDVHWYPTVGGLPAQNYLDIRIASFKSKYGNPGAGPGENLSTTGDAYTTFTDEDLNNEQAANDLAVAVTATSKLIILLRPRLSGNASLPRLSLQDLRFIFDVNVDVPVGVLSVLTSLDGITWSAPIVCDFEKLENLVGPPGSTHYHLDPFTTVLPDSNLPLYYKLVFTSAPTESAKLRRIYFSGNYGASPVLRSKSSSFTYSDVEVWIAHEITDPATGLTGLTADLYQSVDGIKDSFVRTKQSVPLTLSHLVSSGPYKRVYAYRAQMYSETFDLPISAIPEWFLAVNVNQPYAANLQRRVVSALLVESQRNGVGGLIGSFIGTNMADQAVSSVTSVRARRTALAAVAATGPSTFTDPGVTNFTTDPVGPDLPVVAATTTGSDWLVIESGVNAGNHRILSRTATVLTLVTPTANWTAHAATSVVYRIVRGSPASYPAGIEGASKTYRLITNVDIQGSGGFVDIGFGQYSKFKDIAPDGLRTGAGSFGDTGFLTAKVASIMGTSINDVVPVDRTLLGLDARIDALETVTVGLGTLSPLSFGQFNVTDYPSVRATLVAAIAALPNGGTILFKPGYYGMGVGTNIFTDTASSLVITTPGITLQAQAPGTVTLNLSTFGGGAGTRGWAIQFAASNCGIRGIDLASSHFTADTFTDPQNAIWFGSSAAAIANLFAEDIRLVEATVPAAGTGRTRILFGVRNPGAQATLLQTVTNVRLARIDATAITAVSPVIDTHVSDIPGPNPALPRLAGVYIEDCRLVLEGSVSTQSLRLVNAGYVAINNLTGRVRLTGCTDVAIDKSYLPAGIYIWAATYVRVSNSKLMSSGTTQAVNIVPGSPYTSHHIFFSNCQILQGSGAPTTALIFINGSQIAIVGGHIEATLSTVQAIFLTDYSADIYVGDLTVRALCLVRYTGVSTTVGAVTSNINFFNIGFTVNYGAGIDLSLNTVAFMFDAVPTHERLTGLRISNIQFYGIPTSIGTSYASRRAFRLVRVREAVIDRISVLRSTATAGINDVSIEINDSVNTLVANSILVGDSNVGTIYEITPNTNLIRSGVIMVGGDAFVVPAGQHYGAIQRADLTALNDGQEIAKFGLGAATTLRFWRRADHFFLTQNIASLTAPLLTDNAITAVPEVSSAVNPSSLIVVGPGKIGLYSSSEATTPRTLRPVIDSIMNAATDLNMFTGSNLNQLLRIFAQTWLFLGTKGDPLQLTHAGSPSVRLEQFDDAVVLTVNLTYRGASRSSWTNSGWYRSSNTPFPALTTADLTRGSAALVLNFTTPTTDGRRFRYYHLNSSVSVINTTITAAGIEALSIAGGVVNFSNNPTIAGVGLGSLIGVSGQFGITLVPGSVTSSLATRGTNFPTNSRPIGVLVETVNCVVSCGAGFGNSAGNATVIGYSPTDSSANVRIIYINAPG